MISKLSLKNLVPACRKSLAYGFLFLLPILASGQAKPADSLRFEVLMTRQMLSDIHFNDNFIPSFDITTNKFVLLSTPSQFYLLGWGGLKPFANKSSGAIGAFAYTSDHFLMIIRRNELCYFDSVGNLQKLYALPTENMSISAGKNVMYVYDRKSNSSKYSLYVIAKRGKYQKLFQVPSPVQYALETSNSLLFAAGNGLFSFDLKLKELKALAALPKGQEIVSIAIDTAGSRVYFSSGTGIYTLKGSKVSVVTEQFGGAIRYFEDGLLVFDSQKNLLMRMAGVDNDLAEKALAVKVAPTSKKAADTLTNLSIINMVEAKLTDEFIINLIQKSQVNFQVNVDAMIELSAHNVSSAIISAMKAAMRKKAAGEGTKNTSQGG